MQSKHLDLLIKHRNLKGWLICSQTVIAILIGVVYPLVMAFVMSLTDIKLDINHFNFVGLKNYIWVFEGSGFFEALGVSAAFSVVSTLLQTVLGFLVAVMLYFLTRHLQSIFKTIIYLPVVLPGAVISAMWLIVYAGDEYGLLNIEAYFDVIHKPYEKDGVDFWWIDWQQGENSKLKGFDPLWALNHYHYLDNGSERKEPLILSRYADIGSHRYPLGFSGDTVISFDTLNYLPYFTATASNIGYTYWSHDIGGHYGGAKDNELYLRFIQFGVFNPIMRLHGECNPVSTKEPWYYGTEGVIAEKYLRLRHSLIPFLYSYSFVTNRDGYALCEPLYYDYPKDERAYRYKNEYMFGQQLLVIPITSHSEDGYATVKGYLPQGKWTDLFTGQVYDGDKEYEFVRDCESIPVFAKEGAVIPYSEDSGNLCANPNHLRVDIYDGNSEYVFYEDGVTTCFRVENTDNCLRIVVDSGVCTLKRSVKFVLRNVKRGSLNVYWNGTEVEVKKLYADCVSFVIEQFKFGGQYVIEVGKEAQEPLAIKKGEILKKIMKTEGDYSYRQEIYNQVLSSERVSELLAVIEKSEFSETIKKYIEDGLL